MVWRWLVLALRWQWLLPALILLVVLSLLSPLPKKAAQVAPRPGEQAVIKFNCKPTPDRLDCIEPVRAGYTGPVFHGSYDFPQAPPPEEPRPWEAIDFKAQPRAYLDAVLQYVMEGQDPGTWDVANNPVRKWYHMPWMGPGDAGREFTHGLTSERGARAGELSPRQTDCRQTWAVGFFNPQGAYTLGRIWAPVKAGVGDPDLSVLPFKPGTVIAKAIYTEATAEDAPWVKGAPELKARIFKDDGNVEKCPKRAIEVAGQPRTPTEKVLGVVRLVQFDVAVRDPRADSTTGWVFASFVYKPGSVGATLRDRLTPVGLIWGNDPDLLDPTSAMSTPPKVVGRDIRCDPADPAALTQAIDFPPKDTAKPQEGIILCNPANHTGRNGRMNGPVDNPESACTSCHMTAQWPAVAAPQTDPTRTGYVENLVAPEAVTWGVARCWFRNIRGTKPFGARVATPDAECGKPPAKLAGRASSLMPLDYSLQLAAALENRYQYLHRDDWQRRVVPSQITRSFWGHDTRVFDVNRN